MVQLKAKEVNMILTRSNEHAIILSKVIDIANEAP